jgi:ribosomal-protein-alanine N-acetyltransferase
MNQITCRILDSCNDQLLEKIKKLEIDNLGIDAAINEWQIPVIIRYGKFIVAEDSSGEILGVCEIIREWKEEKTAFIHTLYIEKKYRRSGIGKKLLAFTINFLEVDGFSSVELTVDTENLAAVNFYRSFGFTVREKRKNEYGKGNDRLLMELELD